MILHRVVELQSKTKIYDITDSQAEYDLIEEAIESTKASLPESSHHYLIATPFRYPLPIPPRYQARFRPPYFHLNCFYGAKEFKTAAFEYTTHWMRQRVHLQGLSLKPQRRTTFSVSFDDAAMISILKRRDRHQIMNRHDYGPSHDFVRRQKKLSSIHYPSCRDPDQGECVVTFKIETLGKKPRREQSLFLTFDSSQKKTLVDVPLKQQTIEVFWEEVC